MKAEDFCNGNQGIGYRSRWGRLLMVRRERMCSSSRGMIWRENEKGEQLKWVWKGETEENDKNRVT